MISNILDGYRGLVVQNGKIKLSVTQPNVDRRIEKILEDGRVKRHRFKSRPDIWTLVGFQEYWLEPDLGFCSCAGFYFSDPSGRGRCYHLDALKAAMQDGMYEEIELDDEEYEEFVLVLIRDLWHKPTLK